MGVQVREKRKGSGEWWVFIFHRGERASEKVGDKDVAEDAARDVARQIVKRRFDLAAWKAARAPEPKLKPEQKPEIPTLSEFYSKIVTPLWEATISKATVDRYETSFRLHIVPALGGCTLSELTRDRIKDFVVALKTKNAAKRAATEEGQKNEAERRLSKDSIRNIIAALRGTLSEAVERQLIPANPAVRLGKLYREAGKVREEVDPFTADEVPVLLSATLTHFGFDNYAVVLTALHTGMRRSELAGLQWSDVDFRNRFISVRRQFKDGSKLQTKTRKPRKIDISDVLLKELQALKKRRQEEYLSRGKNEIPEWVFLSPGQILWEDGKPVGRAEGQPLDTKNFYGRVFLKACDKAGIRRRRLHDTRHTFASILLMAGESPAYVKEQLGHSSIKMTVDIYGHWIPGANRQAVNRLPSLSMPAISDAATPATR
jgi:integrase